MSEVKTNIGYEITKEKMEHSNYSRCKDDNFAGENELMVTITLAEYRELIREKADHEKADMQSRLWKEQEKARALEQKLEALKALLPCQNDAEDADE